MTRLADLERDLPGVPWGEPAEMDAERGFHGFTCRICLAEAGGYRSLEPEKVYETKAECEAHIQEAHG
jgi:hypothetical protein